MVRKLESGVFVAESRSPAPPRKTPHSPGTRARFVDFRAPPRPRRATSAPTPRPVCAHSHPQRPLSVVVVAPTSRPVCVHGSCCRSPRSHMSRLTHFGAQARARLTHFGALLLPVENQ